MTTTKTIKIHLNCACGSFQASSRLYEILLSTISHVTLMRTHITTDPTVGFAGKVKV
ncbi:hypothetical protein HanHA300_Chr04g0137051 [Helianthus annuus]|nr:hypothetical protein HanHA300_Chr04g0137051 [Helianthus annuus]KAJ0588897.1 hypothetical protein HanIR_Chr04g0180001 [Helianthus annuus]KAJ0597044.1 hypothetical protein HanHA89_Chr04g0150011 [Helianthus annuus]KAJ0757726.1 hypothetical protein HanLR1_Chr04g0142121 [Helianthus annuus]